jgi:hypothetical protein
MAHSFGNKGYGISRGSFSTHIEHFHLNLCKQALLSPESLWGFFLLLLCWGYIVAFTKVPTIYQI